MFRKYGLHPAFHFTSTRFLSQVDLGSGMLWEAAQQDVWVDATAQDVMVISYTQEEERMKRSTYWLD